MDNRLIREAFDFDMNKSKIEHQQLHPLLNPEQRLIYEQNYNLKIRSERKIVLAVASSFGDGMLPAKTKDGEDKPTWIEIPEEFLIKSTDSPIEQIVIETYPNFIERQHDDDYLKERAILTPINDDVDKINAYMFNKLAGQSITYNNADEVCKASTKNLKQQHLFPTEFLNTMNFLGMPPHALCLKRNYQS
nr:ATP-dependent DNA helicase PIF1-like [Tanacetum cinerariifolium]